MRFYCSSKLSMGCLIHYLNLDAFRAVFVFLRWKGVGCHLKVLLLLRLMNILIVCSSVHLRVSSSDCIELLGSFLVLLVTVPAHVKIFDHVKIETFPTRLFTTIATWVRRFYRGHHPPSIKSQIRRGVMDTVVLIITLSCHKSLSLALVILKTDRMSPVMLVPPINLASLLADHWHFIIANHIIEMLWWLFCFIYEHLYKVWSQLFIL